MKRWAVALAVVLAVPGCSGINLGGDSAASREAHSVVFVRPGCDTFIARTLRQGFALAVVADDRYVPTAGDVFEGPAREGQSVFALFPAGAETAGVLNPPPSDNVALNLAALDLSLDAARVRLDAACGR